MPPHSSCSFCGGTGCEACSGPYDGRDGQENSSSSGGCPCEECGGGGSDYDRPDIYTAPKPKSEKEELDEVLGLLYDLNRDKNKDPEKVAQLLGRYKKITGKSKPAFM